jgi:tetratricopeptide (TPR) repeat protein
MQVRLLFATLVVLCSTALVARAESADESFRAAAAALERGAYGEAIDRFEALADRGFQHPDASFDRALAYAGRARSLQAAPGDLGRAAAALEETLLLRPEDAEAERALETVRSEIARRHARRGNAPMMARPSLGRAVATLLPENVWAVVGALGSLAAALGLALRRFSGRRQAELTGGVLIGVGSLLLGTGTTLALAARHLRLTTTQAVVIAEEARLLDESGRPISAKKGESDFIPEGARVWVTDRRGGLSRVEWGSSEGFVVAGQLRELTLQAR